MNFFEEQDRAKRKTVLLMPIFIISACIVVFTWGVLLSTLDLSVSEFLGFILFGGFIGLIGIFDNTKMEIKNVFSSGDKIAAELQGKLLSKQTIDAKEMVLINIINEMSLASGISPLPIYIIEQPTINAFVVGTSYDNAVFTATRGALEHLDRDELQAIIAHEFGHLFNGDVKINNYVSICIVLLRQLLLISTFSFVGKIMSMTEEEISKEISKFPTWTGLKAIYSFGIISILFVASIKAGIQHSYIIFSLIGFIVGYLFASLIQKYINYQREYLADANAVQFTRNPDAMAFALLKIKKYGYKIKAFNEKNYNHIFFASSSSPSIDKRLLRIKPDWNGKTIKIKYKKLESEINTIAKAKFLQAQTNILESLVATVTLDNALGLLDNTGTITPKQIEVSSKILQVIPENIKDSLANPLEAEFIVYAMLLDIDKSARKLQIEMIVDKLMFYEAYRQNAINKITKLYNNISLINEYFHLDIINLSISTLKSISNGQYNTFRSLVNELIDYDDHISLFEWCIRCLVIYPLDISFGIRQVPSEKSSHTHARSLNQEISVLLSAILYSQHRDDTKANLNLQKLKEKSDILYIPHNDISPLSLKRAVNELQSSKPLIRKRVLELVILSVSVNKRIDATNMKLVYALGEVLHLPLGKGDLPKNL